VAPSATPSGSRDTRTGRRRSGHGEQFPQFPIVNYLAFVQREVHAFVLDVAPGFTITPRAQA
jgi:hypothetical protein